MCTQGRATDDDLKGLVLWQFSESLAPGWEGKWFGDAFHGLRWVWLHPEGGGELMCLHNTFMDVWSYIVKDIRPKFEFA